MTLESMYTRLREDWIGQPNGLLKFSFLLQYVGERCLAVRTETRA